MYECVKNEWKMDKQKHRQRVQNKISSFFKMKAKYFVESVVSALVYPLFHLIFHHLTDLPNLSFLSLSLSLYIYIFL